MDSQRVWLQLNILEAAWIRIIDETGRNNAILLKISKCASSGTQLRMLFFFSKNRLERVNLPTMSVTCTLLLTRSHANKQNKLCTWLCTCKRAPYNRDLLHIIKIRSTCGMQETVDLVRFISSEKLCSYNPWNMHAALDQHNDWYLLLIFYYVHVRWPLKQW